MEVVGAEPLDKDIKANGLPFEEALVLLKQNYIFTRQEWEPWELVYMCNPLKDKHRLPGADVIYIRSPYLYKVSRRNKTYPYFPSNNDLFATDWEIAGQQHETGDVFVSGFKG